MNRRKISFTVPILLLAATATTCITGCVSSGSAWKRERIYSAAGVNLFREYQEADGQTRALGYRHTIDVSPEKIALILSRITFEHKTFLNDPEDRYVFAPAEVQRAAEPISLALSELSPDDRLRVLVVHDTWETLLRGTLGSTAVLFSTQDRVLDIAFTRVRDGVAGLEDDEPDTLTFPYDPTKYTRGTPLRPMPGAELHVDEQTGETFPRWLEVRPDDIEVAPITRLAQTQAAEGTGVAAAGTEDSTPPPPTAEESRVYHTIRSKVELLKKLRKDGVITQDEYAEQMDKVLSGE
jgi:hypothetical protein